MSLLEDKRGVMKPVIKQTASSSVWSNYEGLEVPEVLLSGHHENIRRWRLNEQIKRTKERRPDLLEKSDLNGKC